MQTIISCAFFSICWLPTTTTSLEVNMDAVCRVALGNSLIISKMDNEVSARIEMPTGNDTLKMQFCNLRYNSSKGGILQLSLTNSNVPEGTPLICNVLDEQGMLVLSRSVKEAIYKTLYRFHICPSTAPSKSASRNYSMLFLAPPLTVVLVSAILDESIMTQGETTTFVFAKHMGASRLFAFDVTSTEGKYDHLQITVSSEDETLECLLVVSKSCSDATDIDPQAINVKETQGTLHLSFTTFGRITLTHASKPQLSPGRWYIGVFSIDAHKNANDFFKRVSVSTGFVGGINRASFGKPIAYLIMVSIFGGIVISAFAHFFLNPEFHNKLIHKFRLYVHSYIFDRPGEAQDHENSIPRNSTEHPEEKTVRRCSNYSTPGGSTECENTNLRTGSISLATGQELETYDVDELGPRAKYWPGLKNWGNVVVHWFSGNERSYAYTTAIVAFSLVTGAVQFIVFNWQDMIDSGNRDLCYYNEGCYRSTPYVDIPYNLIISNVPYVIHGLILALSISLREATCRVNERTFRTTTRKDSFSIMYAFAWSLAFQGLFSSFYHICPSRMTFQFDSAFMFVISGLVVVAMYNSLGRRHSQDPPDPVLETKLFLFFVIPLLLLNYLGSVRDTDGFLLFPNAVFYSLCVLWIVSMFVWVFYRIMLPWTPRAEPMFWCRLISLCVLFPIVLVIIGQYTVDLKKDWSIFFLFTCIAAVICAVIGYSVTVCLQNIYEQMNSRPDSTSHERRKSRWIMIYLRWPIMNFHVVVYIGSTLACWLLALIYFQQKQVTDKVLRPSKSRELNAECTLWDFFDDHDKWHILSSFALLQSAFFVIWCIG